MKQVIQNLETGKTEVWEVPDPTPLPGEIQIKTICSLVSTGTEKSLTDFGKSNWIDRIRNNPEKVTMVLEKVKKDGLRSALATVKAKLHEPMQLGYSNVGLVQRDFGQFKTGDRVVSNGRHAGMVCLPANLVHKIPANVSNETASFTVVSSIALQSVRLIKPEIGEVFVVYGLGLIGLLAVQILSASGCKVIGVDIDERKRSLCESAGAKFVAANDSLIDHVISETGGYGVDGVIIAASAKSDDIISNSAKFTRQRGRIVLLGVVDLDISRSDFYEKEITFQVSCSYGPGRYDPTYEAGGLDYPLPFVRWTENRNFGAVLALMDEGKVDPQGYITSKYDISDAAEAYKHLGSFGEIATLFEYNSIEPTETVELAVPAMRSLKAGIPVISVVGSGNYANSMLLPLLSGNKCQKQKICSSKGLSAVSSGSNFGFSEATTNVASVFECDKTDAIIVATRHDTHAQYITEAVKNNKHIFIEKPLCINSNQFLTLNKILSRTTLATKVMVGFNRRYSPHIEWLCKSLEGNKSPKTYNYTIHAGRLPKDHWTLDPKIGGGRLVGEGCHFVDLICFVENDYDPNVHITYGLFHENDYSGWIITLKFSSGSIASINYVCNSSVKMAKERFEVSWLDNTAIVNNFIESCFLSGSSTKRFKTRGQDKGQKKCIDTFFMAISDESFDPMPIDQLLSVSKMTLDLAQDDNKQ